MFHVFGTLEDRKLLEFFFVFRVIGGHMVDSGERRLLFLQIVKKAFDVVLFSFNNNFYDGVSSIPHVASESVFYSNPIDEGSKTHPLNDAADLDFSTQQLVDSYS